MRIKVNPNTLFISLGFFFLFAGFSGAQQYIVPLFKLEGQQNLALISLLILYITFLFSNFIVSKAIFRLGLKPSLVLGAMSYGIYIISAFSRNPLILYPASILIGFGASLLWISSGQIIVRSSKKETIGTDLGLQQSFFSAGALFGVGIGALFLEILPPSILYIIFAILVFLSIPFFLKLKIEEEKVANKTIDFSFLLRRESYLIFPIVVGSYYLSGLGFSAINLIALTFGLGFVGFLSTTSRVGVIFGGVLSGKLADNFNKRILLYLLVLTGLLSSLLLINSFGTLTITLGAIFLSLSHPAVYTLCLSLLEEKVEKEDYTNMAGVFFIYANIGIVGALLSSIYLEPRSSFIPGIVLLILALPAIHIFSKR